MKTDTRKTQEMDKIIKIKTTGQIKNGTINNRILTKNNFNTRE